MPVEIIAVAVQGQLLVQDHTPNLKQSQVVKKLIETATRNDSKNTYSFEGSLYHCMVENEICYLCATDPQSTTLMAYTLLQDVKTQFIQHFFKDGVVKTAELNPVRCAAFSGKLQVTAKTYTDNPKHNSKLGKLKDDIEVVKSTMLQNLDDLVKRGGDLDRMCEKTEMLAEDAHVFDRESNRLKNKMFWRNVKIAIAIVIALALIIFIIVWIACGISFQKCKSDDPPATPHPTASP
jgi:vesicle-associated membrane protein 7